MDAAEGAGGTSLVPFLDFLRVVTAIFLGELVGLSWGLVVGEDTDFITAWNAVKKRGGRYE